MSIDQQELLTLQREITESCPQGSARVTAQSEVQALFKKHKITFLQDATEKQKSEFKKDLLELQKTRYPKKEENKKS